MKEVWPAGWKTAGHYAPAIISRGSLYVSGQLPVVQQTKKVVEGGIRAQMKAALENLDAVLRAAGVGRGAVVLCRVYLSDIADWDAANGVYAEFFGAHRPARVIVPTRSLHYGARVEVEAIAEMEEKA